MPKSEREETLSALTARVFQAMLEELVMDATLQSHQEVVRSRTLCKVCKTRCGSVHTPASAASAAAAAVAASRAGTPSSAASADVPLARTGGQANGTGASTPTSQGQRGADGTLLLECVSCARQIASNRYAPHLSSCMGLNSTRRGAPRTSASANAKAKPPSDTGRSASPLSDLGHLSDDIKVTKGKAKAKKGGDEGEFSLKRKRPGSPQISPNKKSKKNKASGSPVSRVKADPDSSGLPSTSHFSPSSANTSHSKIPSKLRASSTASFLERDDSSDDSRSSEPEPGRGRAHFGTAPNGKGAGIGGAGKPGNGGPRPPAMGTGPPKRPTPPRPPPVHVPGYEYEVDHANETGSSTDTDSD